MPKCTMEIFVRDNMNGNPVVRATTRKDGGFSYKMKQGWTNELSVKESEKLTGFMERTGFKIRMENV